MHNSLNGPLVSNVIYSINFQVVLEPGNLQLARLLSKRLDFLLKSIFFSVFGVLGAWLMWVCFLFCPICVSVDCHMPPMVPTAFILLAYDLSQACTES